MRVYIKKTAAALLAALLLCLTLAGCAEFGTSYTFNVETGQSIKVDLRTAGGYSISQKDGSFFVGKDGELQTTGIFMTKETCTEYLANAAGAEGVTVLDSADDMVFYLYEGVYTYIIDLGKTGVALTNEVSQESAQACIDRLSYEVV